MPDILRDALILNVDDDPAGRYAVTRILQHAGCAVMEALTGEQALVLAAQSPVDLILLDVNLPGISGLEVVEHLKEDPATASIPVLHLSATSTSPEAVARGLEGGADGYLTEPVTPEVLLSTVRALLRMRRAVQEAEQQARELAAAVAQLQMTREELEVANEELAVANEELQTSYDEIERQRSFFEALLQQVPVGINIGYDPSGRVVTTNPAGKEIYEVASGENVSVSAPPDQRPANRYFQGRRELTADDLPMQQAVAQDRVLRDVEIELRSASGQQRWLRVNAAPVHDSDGKTIGSVSVTWDITEQRRAEEALRASEERFRSVLGNSSDCIYRYNMQAERFEYISPAAETIVDYAPEELAALTGEQALAMIHPDDLPAMQTALLRLEQTGQAEAEYRQQAKGGGYRWISNHMSLTRDGAGHPLYRDGTIRDVTARREAEEERECQRERLLAAERARAELAENLSREIAHRTKNNLAMAAGVVQLQVMQQRDPQTSGALSETLTRLMAFASIQEELQSTTAIGWVDLLPVLRRIGTASAGASPGGEAAVSVAGESVALPSKAATNLAIVANELITNAVKYGTAGPDGKLRVGVEIESHDDTLRLCVWNSGHPVPEGFDAAQQQGLGLRLVGDITRQYGGAFTLRPERDGTTAEVIAPLAELRQG